MIAWLNTLLLLLSAVDLKNAPGSVYEGKPQGEKAGCMLTLSDEDFIGFVSGSLNPQKVSSSCTICLPLHVCHFHPQQAFATGRLKLGGNILLSQKLSAVFPTNKAKL